MFVVSLEKFYDLLLKLDLSSSGIEGFHRR